MEDSTETSYQPGLAHEEGAGLGINIEEEANTAENLDKKISQYVRWAKARVADGSDKGLSRMKHDDEADTTGTKLAPTDSDETESSGRSDAARPAASDVDGQRHENIEWSVESYDSDDSSVSGTTGISTGQRTEEHKSQKETVPSSKRPAGNIYNNGAANGYNQPNHNQPQAPYKQPRAFYNQPQAPYNQPIHHRAGYNNQSHPSSPQNPFSPPSKFTQPQDFANNDTRTPYLPTPTEEPNDKLRQRIVGKSRPSNRVQLVPTDTRTRFKPVDEPSEIIVPGINRMNWEEFKAKDDKRIAPGAEPVGSLRKPKLYKRHRSKKGTSKLKGSIDVLIEEPRISVGFLTSQPAQGMPVCGDSGDQSANDGTKESGKPGRAATIKPSIPERIRINSPHIIQVLQAIQGKNNMKIELVSEPLVIIRPFKLLDYYELKIRSWYRNLMARFPLTGDNSKTTPGDYDSDDLLSLTTLQHLRFLIDFMDTDMKPRIQYVRDPNCDKVSFSDIGYMFKPGDNVISKDNSQVYLVVGVRGEKHRVIRHPLTQTSNDEAPAIINCVSIDFDGTRLGPIPEDFGIKRFDNEVYVTSLPIRPLHGSISELLSRGRKFLDMIQIRHMHYDGLTLDTMEEVDSQVVIDFEAAFANQENHPNPGDRFLFSKKKDLWKPVVENLVGISMVRDCDIPVCTFECCREDTICDDSFTEKNQSTEFMSSLVPRDRSRIPSLAIYPRPKNEVHTEENPITDDEILIMSHRVFGFVLRSRKWSKFPRITIQFTYRVAATLKTLNPPHELMMKCKQGYSI